MLKKPICSKMFNSYTYFLINLSCAVQLRRPPMLRQRSRRPLLLRPPPQGGRAGTHPRSTRAPGARGRRGRGLNRPRTGRRGNETVSLKKIFLKKIGNYDSAEINDKIFGKPWLTELSEVFRGNTRLKDVPTS